MKKSKKIAIIIAIALIVTGSIIASVVFAGIQFDFSKLNTMKFTENTYSIEEAFNNISIEGVACDLKFEVSEDNLCKVVCNESDSIYYNVDVNDNTLIIEKSDIRKWYEFIGIYWVQEEMTIYLPKTEYDTLYLLNYSGDAEISDTFSFTDVEINNTSGDVYFSAKVENYLSLKTVSGDIYISDVKAKNMAIQSTSGEIRLISISAEQELELSTVSGNMEITALDCQSLSAESVSGDISFEKSIASENIKIESVSGEVKLTDSDAQKIYIKTTSGDVRGTLLSGKLFITDTTSGDVDVPRSALGGECEIITTSGNIKFKIVD